MVVANAHHEVESSNLWSEKQLLTMVAKADHPLMILVRDGVTDPHNLGACLRSADAAGVDAVIVPKDKSADPNATVRKVAVGAAEVVPFVRVDLDDKKVDLELLEAPKPGKSGPKPPGNKPAKKSGGKREAGSAKHKHSKKQGRKSGKKKKPGKKGRTGMRRTY